MDKFSFYFRRKVTRGDLNTTLSDIESAVETPISQLYGAGFLPTPTVTEKGVPNLSIDIGAFISYNKQGKRVQITSALNLVLTNDGITNVGTAGTALGASITVPTAGNERWLTILAYYNQLFQDPQIDGNGQSVFFRTLDSFHFSIIAGATATTGSAVKPTHPGDNGILLVDVKLRSTGIILNADIDSIRQEVLNTTAVTSAEINAARDSAAKSTIYGSVDARLESSETDFITHKQSSTDDHLNYLNISGVRALTGRLDFAFSNKEYMQLDALPTGAKLRSYIVDTGAGNIWYEKTFNVGRVLSGGTPTGTWNNRDINAITYLERIGVGTANAGVHEIQFAPATGSANIPVWTVIQTITNSGSMILGTVPATQITSGAFPSGVTIPATQVTSGAFPSGVTIPDGGLSTNVALRATDSNFIVKQTFQQGIAHQSQLLSTTDLPITLSAITGNMVIGSIGTSQHLAVNKDTIQSKLNSTSISTLKLNPLGGTVSIGGIMQVTGDARTSRINYAVTSGDSTNYTASFTPPFTSLIDGLKLTLKPHVSNLTMMTLNVDGLGPKGVSKKSSLGLLSTDNKDVIIDQDIDVTYHLATNVWILENPGTHIYSSTPNVFTTRQKRQDSGDTISMSFNRSTSNDYQLSTNVLDDAFTQEDTTKHSVLINPDNAAGGLRIQMIPPGGALSVKMAWDLEGKMTTGIVPLARIGYNTTLTFSNVPINGQSSEQIITHGLGTNDVMILLMGRGGTFFGSWAAVARKPDGNIVVGTGTNIEMGAIAINAASSGTVRVNAYNGADALSQDIIVDVSVLRRT